MHVFFKSSKYRDIKCILPISGFTGKKFDFVSDLLKDLFQLGLIVVSIVTGNNSGKCNNVLTS